MGFSRQENYAEPKPGGTMGAVRGFHDRDAEKYYFQPGHGRGEFECEKVHEAMGIAQREIVSWETVA